MGIARTALGLWLTSVLCCACEEDPKAPSTTAGFANGDVNPPGGSGGAATDTGSDASVGGVGGGGGASRSLEQVCGDYCDAEGDCQPGGTDPACVEQCVFSYEIFDDDCQKRIKDELSCLASVSCDALETVGDGRRAHLQCGDFAEGFFTRCTFGNSAVSSVCTDLCGAQISCSLESVSLARCEEDCTLHLTGLMLTEGEQCAAAREDFLACVAREDCDTLGDDPPANCAALEQDFRDTCLQ